MEYEEVFFLPGVLDDTPYIEISSITQNAEPIDNIDSAVIDNSEPTIASNCLALTIVPDYKLISLKNIITRSTHITYKVLFSTFMLYILKLFL